MPEYLSLSEKIKRDVRDKILFLREYKPGDQIKEAQLADEFGVSRAPIREALHELAIEGLVVLKPRRGMFVIKLTRQEIKEIFEIRLILEERIFKEIVRRRLLTATAYSDLGKIVGEMEQAALLSGASQEQKVREFSFWDIKFHQYCWNLSGKAYSFRMLTSIYYQIILAIQEDLIHEHNLGDIVDAHRSILEYLKNSDYESIRNIRMSTYLGSQF